MAPSLGALMFCSFFFLHSTNGDTVKWCGTNQRTLNSYKPAAKFHAKSKIQCVALSLRCKHVQWPIQSVEYFNGRCVLYTESTEAIECGNTHRIGYWARNLSDQGWIPVFRAYNGSGLEVFHSWNSISSGSMTEEGPSPLLFQDGIWPLISEVKLSMHNDNKEVIFITFNVTASDHNRWFSRDRISNSSYVDLASDLYNPEFPEAYSIKGYEEPRYEVIRRFYAHWYHNGCPGDRGWMAVLDQTPGYCDWERNGIRPSFMYCPGSTHCLYADMSFADMFLISARF